MIRARHAFLLLPMLLLGYHAPAGAAGKAKAKKAKEIPVVSVTAACSDFYNYADEAWLKAHPAPTEGSISAFDTMKDNARSQERTLLEEMARSPSDDSGHALGTLWTDGMNEAAVDSAGAMPLQPLFDRIAKVKKGKDVAAAVADLHAAGIPVLFNFAGDADLKDVERRIGYATQGGLGLPDPDYYTRTDAETRDLLGRYRAYIQTILQLSGTPADQVSVQSGWVLSMEMQLAQSSLPLAQLRGADASYRPATLVELQKAYPNLALGNFLKAQHVADASISLAHTGFFATADGMVANTPVEQWQAYLRFHVASAMAPYLSHAFQDAHFQMYDKLLGGAKLPRDRAQQVMDAVDRALGATMGHAYAQRYLPPATKDAATHVVDALRAATGDAIDHNAWMDASTRAAAQAKLRRLRIEIGEPAGNAAPTGVVLGTGYASDMLALAGWRHQGDMEAIGKRDDGHDWPVPAQIPAASYDLLRNRIVVTAAFLQPPVLDPGMDAARQFGALGTLVGHQLHYAFDGKGRGVDADGQIHDWWNPEASAAYEARIAPIVAQYDAYAVDTNVKVDGNRTRDENLADLGGVELAWSAFKAATPPPVPGKPGQPPPERDFFDAYAQVWARNSAPASAIAQAATSVQAPAKYRVDGVLANVPEFGKAYVCKAGQPMQLTAPVSVWR